MAQIYNTDNLMAGGVSVGYDNFSTAILNGGIAVPMTDRAYTTVDVKNNVFNEINATVEKNHDGPMYKYNEPEIITALKEYVDKTYGQHYNTNKKITCFDAWMALGDAAPTFRNTAIKYLWRYGKKNGNNKDDLMKALHYIMLTLHADHYKTKGE